MTRFCIKLRGTPEIVEIEAATFEEVRREGDLEAIIEGAPGDRIAKDADGKQTGWFSGKDIAGWWIKPEPADLSVKVQFVGSESGSGTIEKSNAPGKS